MYKRKISLQLKSYFQHYPIITVLGPRQSGKSTLVKNLFQNLTYVNLEDPEVRQMANNDPKQFLGLYNQGAILDEIQNVPQLLSYIQVLVDDVGKNGMFVLIGSHQLELHKNISQSLAGRTALLTLLPLSIAEMEEAGFDYNLDKLLFTGAYPRIYKEHLEPNQMYRDYYRTYIQRDLRNMINVKDLSLFEKFVKLCAGRVGNIFDANKLANEVGVSNHTISNWLSILEASYIVFRLQPYYENFNKRIIKSHKIYFYDTGLAAYLLNIENPEHMALSAFKGALFENLIILELIKYRYNQGKDHNLYYFRDHNQNEIDVIFKYRNQLYPIEIKSAQTFHMQFLKNLKYFKKIVGDRMPTGFLVYSGDLQQKVLDISVLKYKNLQKFWDALI